MADPNLNIKQNVSPAILQRTILLGRVKMAQAIRMPENEWAKLLSEIEKDKLFTELLSVQSEGEGIIKYKRYGKTGISGQFYEDQESRVAGGNAGEAPEALLLKRKHMLKLIQKVGQENFEKYFLFREHADQLEAIAKTCNITSDEAQDIQNFILDMSVQAEFFHPSALDSNRIVKPTLVGRIIHNEDGTYSISFFSPHLARGQYQINHSALKKWQKNRGLNRDEASRLRKFIGLLELSNLKQGAFWRVMEYLLVVQKEYFDTKDPAKMAAISLRKVARHLQFAPSTISRVMGNKSVLLPWEREVMISDLMPGQRRVVLNILEKELPQQLSMPDVKLAAWIAEHYGVRVSRRTITACRHVVNDRQKAA